MSINIKKYFSSINSSYDFLVKYFIAFLSICFLELMISTFVGIKSTIFFENDQFADLLKVGDYLKIVDCWKPSNPYDLFGINFLPPLSIIFYVFFLNLYTLFSNQISPGSFYLLLVLVLYFIIYFNLKRSSLPKHYFLYLFSFPILFSLERGNFAFFVFMAIFLSTYFRKNEFLSMVFLAIAVSIKITPIIFILLLVHGKKLKDLLYSGAKFFTILLAINFSSLLFIINYIKPSIYNPFNFFSAQKIYENIMIEKFGGINFCSSFYMPIYYFFQTRFAKNHYSDVILSNNPYLLVISIGLFFLLLIFFKFRISFMNIWNNYYLKLEVLCLIIILFSPISADYYLSIAMVPLLNYYLFKISSKRMVFYMLLFLPKVFFIGDVTISSLLNPLLITILLYFILIETNKTICREII